MADAADLKKQFRGAVTAILYQRQVLRNKHFELVQLGLISVHSLRITILIKSISNRQWEKTN